MRLVPVAVAFLLLAPMASSTLPSGHDGTEGLVNHEAWPAPSRSLDDYLVLAPRLDDLDPLADIDPALHASLVAHAGHDHKNWRLRSYDKAYPFTNPLEGLAVQGDGFIWNMISQDDGRQVGAADVLYTLLLQGKPQPFYKPEPFYQPEQPELRSPQFNGNLIRSAVGAWNSAIHVYDASYSEVGVACNTQGHVFQASMARPTFPTCQEWFEALEIYNEGVNLYLSAYPETGAIYDATGVLCMDASVGALYLTSTTDIASPTNQGSACVKDTDRDGYSDNVEIQWGSDFQDYRSIPGNPSDTDEDRFDNSRDNCSTTWNPGQKDLDRDGMGDVCDSDRDGDGFSNNNDAFPDDGAEWADTDQDGVGQNGDNCPGLSNPRQNDFDGDGAGDPCDSDDDNDGVPDSSDNCHYHKNGGQADFDSDGAGDACDPDDDNDGRSDAYDDAPYDPSIQSDGDNDGIDSSVDNCPSTYNPGQTDSYGDSRGDACEPDPSETDSDNDGIKDDKDNCVNVANSGQADMDGDGIGNKCDDDPDGDGVWDGTDNCDQIANPGQQNSDSDAAGDACDDDDDNDGIPDHQDSSARDSTRSGDSDGDGIDDLRDNCPSTSNRGQADFDQDGRGDECDVQSVNIKVWYSDWLLTHAGTGGGKGETELFWFLRSGVEQIETEFNMDVQWKGRPSGKAGIEFDDSSYCDKTQSPSDYETSFAAGGRSRASDTLPLILVGWECWDPDTLGFYSPYSNWMFSSHVGGNAGYQNNVVFGVRDVIVLQHELGHGWGASDYYYDEIQSNGNTYDDLVDQGISIVDGDARSATYRAGAQSYEVSLSAVQNACTDASSGNKRTTTAGGGLGACSLVQDGYVDFPYAMTQVRDADGNNGWPMHSYPKLGAFGTDWSNRKVDEFLYGENHYTAIRLWYGQWS